MKKLYFILFLLCSVGLYAQESVMTGVSAKIELDFKISPNPVSTVLNLHFENRNDISVAVFDVLGKQIFNSEFSNQLKASINTSNWNRGVYLLRVTSNTEAVVKRFIKQ